MKPSRPKENDNGSLRALMVAMALPLLIPFAAFAFQSSGPRDLVTGSYTQCPPGMSDDDERDIVINALKGKIPKDSEVRDSELFENLDEWLRTNC